MTYSVIFTTSAIKDMRKIPKSIRAEVWDVVEELKHIARPRDAKKLKGYDVLYRIRIAGRYRIVYELKKKVCMIMIIKVGDRKDVYKNL